MFQVDLAALRAHPGQPARLTVTGVLESLRHADEGEPVVPDPLRVTLQASFLGGVYWLEGTVEGTAVLRCGRCLEEFRHPFLATFKEKYRQGGTKAADEETLPDEDRLELDEKIRETVLLALPMRPLCREDCLGLCPRCGKTLNEGPCACPPGDIDSRMAKLAVLLNDGEKGVQ